MELVPHPNRALGVSQEGFLTKVMTRIRYLDWAGWRQISIDREFSQFRSKLAGERHCVNAEKFLVVLDSPYIAGLRMEHR